MDSVNHLDGVAITGIGLALPLGLTCSDVVKRIRGLDSGVGRLTRFPFEGAAAAEVPEFELRGILRKPRNEKLMSPAVRLAAHAAYHAIAQSGLDLESVDRERVALHTGSGHTGICYDVFFPALSVAWKDDPERDFKNLGGRATRLIDPYFSMHTLSNSGIGLLSAEHDLRGPGCNFVQGDTASARALEAAANDLREGRCDAALAGGYDSLLVKSSFLSYLEGGLLSSSGVQAPFAAGSDGIVLGEGAAFFVLERVEDAAVRGAAPLAILQWSVNASASGGNGLFADGLPALAPALRTALQSEPRPDFVVARGIGTVAGDAEEAPILAEFQHAGSRVTSFKALTGYVGAATAATEIALTILCARAGFLPPAAPLGGRDSTLPFQPETEAAAIERGDLTVLALSGGWTGQGSAMAFKIPASKEKDTA